MYEEQAKSEIRRKDGWVERWNSGMLENWKIEIVEKWNDGKME